MLRNQQILRFSSYSIRMATRRSARLSSINDASAKDDTPKPKKPIKKETSPVKASRKSNKRKTSDVKKEEENVDETGGFSKSAPKRGKKDKRDGHPDDDTHMLKQLGIVATATKPIRHNTPPPIERLANPHLSNAPLLSPETSRLVTNKALADASPSKPSAHPRITTTDILEKAIGHLVKTEPKLKDVIEKHHCHLFSPDGLAEVIDPFNSLASSIIAQQVSGAAAKSIKRKFVGLFNSPSLPEDQHLFPTPSQVSASSIETLRSAGLSQRKAEYVKGLAEKFHTGDLSAEILLNAEYEEIFEKLIAVRGLGKWSVEMFACFGLKRLDVFSTGDLGVQRGMAALIGRDVEKLKNSSKGKWKYMAEQEMIDIADKFSPYRSVFMWYMWRFEDVDIAALGQ